MLNKILQNDIFTAIESIYSVSLENIQLQKTRKEFKRETLLWLYFHSQDFPKKVLKKQVMRLEFF